MRCLSSISHCAIYILLWPQQQVGRSPDHQSIPQPPTYVTNQTNDLVNEPWWSVPDIVGPTGPEFLLVPKLLASSPLWWQGETNSPPNPSHLLVYMRVCWMYEVACDCGVVDMSCMLYWGILKLGSRLQMDIRLLVGSDVPPHATPKGLRV